MADKYPGPPPWRGEIFYQHENGHGFEETYWLIAADVPTAMTDLIALATARQAMFDSECRVKYWRVSDPDLKGDTEVRPATSGTIGTYGTGDPKLADMMPPEVSLKIRCQAADRYWAYRMIRMLPEDCIEDGQWVPTPAMTTAFNNWVTAFLSKCQGVFKDIHEANPTGALILKTWTSVTPLSISTKRCGRPFGLRRGRSVLR